MRIAITGGCGFLGSNLAAEAMGRGCDVVVFDNLSRVGAAANKAWLETVGPFKYLHGDIRLANDVDRLVTDFRPDVVFHLAGQVAMTTSLANPRLDFETNALGTFNLLDSLRRGQPDAIVVYSSTNKVYGDLESYDYRETTTRYEVATQPNGFDESTPLDFSSPYGCSKGCADQYMLDFARIYGLRTVVFRHSSLYGGRQYATYDQGWIGWFCAQALLTKLGQLSEPFTISGNGKQVRDVLHVDDVKALYFQAVDNIGSAAGHAFNIGGGANNSLSLLELFGLLEEVLGIELQYRQIEPRQSDQRVFIADIGKAGRMLRWQPQVGARAGIEEMLKWVRASGVT